MVKDRHVNGIDGKRKFIYIREKFSFLFSAVVGWKNCEVLAVLFTLMERFSRISIELHDKNENTSLKLNYL